MKCVLLFAALQRGDGAHRDAPAFRNEHEREQKEPGCCCCCCCCYYCCAGRRIKETRGKSKLEARELCVLLQLLLRVAEEKRENKTTKPQQCMIRKYLNNPHTRARAQNNRDNCVTSNSHNTKCNICKKCRTCKTRIVCEKETSEKRKTNTQTYCAHPTRYYPAPATPCPTFQNASRPSSNTVRRRRSSR